MTTYPAYRPTSSWATVVDLAQTLRCVRGDFDGYRLGLVILLLDRLGDRFALAGGPRERDLADTFLGLSSLLTTCVEEIDQLQKQLQELAEEAEDLEAQLCRQDEAEGEAVYEASPARWDEDSPLTEPDDT